MKRTGFVLIGAIAGTLIAVAVLGGNASDTDTGHANGHDITSGVRTQAEPGDFRLPATNFVSTRVTGMQPDIVMPRPDSERGPDSRYSFAYPGIPYEVPVVVQGGSYPFRCRVTATGGEANTTGLAIGSEVLIEQDGWLQRPDDYCVVRWTPDVGDDEKRFQYTVEVTDQDGNVATVTVSGRVSRDKFVFYDSSDSGSQETGTIEEPFNDWYTAFGANVNARHNAGKIMYIRGGDHLVAGYADSRAYVGGYGNFHIHGNASKPKSFIGYPGEYVRLNLSVAFFVLRDTDDTWFSGIDFHDNDSLARRGYMFMLQDKGDRQIWWRNIFTDYSVGTECGSSNCAIFFAKASKPARSHMAWISNRTRGRQGTFLQLYTNTGFVIEDNRQSPDTDQNQHDSSSSAVIFLKDSPKLGSVRANYFFGAKWSDTVLSTAALGGQAGIDRVEFCWNWFSNPAPDSATDGALRVTGFKSRTGSLYTKSFFYRNTLDGRMQEWIGYFPQTGYVGFNIATGRIDPGIVGTVSTGRLSSADETHAVLAEYEPDQSNGGTNKNYTNRMIRITDRSGNVQSTRILSHDIDSDTITVAEWPGGTPERRSKYAIESSFEAENNIDRLRRALDDHGYLKGNYKQRYLGTHGAQPAR